MHTQSTPDIRTVAAISGYILPATADQRTPLGILPLCEDVYHRCNGGKVSRPTLSAVMDAMRDSSAVVVLYVGADGGRDARVLWPSSVTLAKNGEIVTYAYCSLRRERKSFRLDRMLTCHALTTPEDLDRENDEPHQDREDSPQAWRL